MFSYMELERKSPPEVAIAQQIDPIDPELALSMPLS
jgi:hypothetical protein